jgi:Predicted glycosyltransferases
MPEGIAQPLVSIIVITYNSSKYVLETLESTKDQTYQNIELIVSDDCSTDNTVEICQKWINENKERFVRTELITIDSNTGIPANCNRGVKKASGDWFKLIAGDDILLHNCISDGVQFINQNTHTKIFASIAIDLKKKYQIEKESDIIKSNCHFFSPFINSKHQLEILLNQNPIQAPATFISKLIYEINGGFDEKIWFMEDYPFWIKTVKNGVKIDFMPKTTVAYRLSDNSISGYNDTKLFNNFYPKHFKFLKEYIFEELSTKKKLNHTYIFLIKWLFDHLRLNNKKFKFIYFLLLKLNIFSYSMKKNN